MKVNYSSNNSGGYWWLEDKDWYALEKAGWVVEWIKNKKRNHWLGALATNATFECETPIEAIKSFEKATGQSASDRGCRCCGHPHSFSWTNSKGYDDYISGEEISELLNKKRIA